MSPYDQRGTATALLITAGLGTRYRLNPRFDLTFDMLFSRSLAAPIYPSGSAGITGSGALGLRYRFGRR